MKSRALGLLLLWLLHPTASSGCIISLRTLPGWFVTGELAFLPSNAAGLVWDLRGEELPEFEVVRIAPRPGPVAYTIDAEALPSPLSETHRLIRPADGLAAGATYVFRVRGDLKRSARVEVGETPVRPRGGASVELGTALFQRVNVDVCGQLDIDAGTLPVYLRLPVDARDHAAELVYQTFVDGKPWYWRPDALRRGTTSLHGPSRDGLIFDCDSSLARRPGTLAPRPPPCRDARDLARNQRRLVGVVRGRDEVPGDKAPPLWVPANHPHRR